MNTLTCRREARRLALRSAPKIAGIDYLEVSADHLNLRVHFLGALPHPALGKEHLRIEGGRRVRDIRVIGVFPHTFNDPELDDYADVLLDRFGDFSTYTLRVVGRADFDPRYDHIDFTFTAGCLNEFDCPEPEQCGQPQHPPTAINYLAKDYASFRRLLFDRLAVTLPDWKNRLVPDIGVTLVEVFAYVADYLSYYQDAVATEAYLDTARQRVSVRRHARLVDYALHEGCNARAFVVVGVSDKLEFRPGVQRFITAPSPHAPVALRKVDGPHLVYEALRPVTTHPGHDEIEIYTWGDSECCLPKGATAATLLDRPAGQGRWLQLHAGDWLILEERIGPKTGLEADRDPNHRWAVRLTAAHRGRDPLTGALIVDVEWAKQDALPFSLCLSSIGRAPQCELLTKVSVARANVVLVDHGASVTETLPPVEAEDQEPECHDAGRASEITLVPKLYRPKLQQPSLTHCAPLAASTPAADTLNQDPHRALPAIVLGDGRPGDAWYPVADLLDQRAMDRTFTVEVDDNRVAAIRFGDGTHGAHPGVGAALTAHYRVGGGREGNVGAEAIAHVLWDSESVGLIESVRNPMPARGGTDPQALTDAKLCAPHAFRARLERAVTADDYAALAQREFPNQVQRAAAALRWNGSWYEALVAIDAFGSAQASPALLRQIKRRLSIYRRIGHDLRVEAAIRVPVLIKLRVCVRASYVRAHVQAALLARFAEFFAPDNLTFGRPLYLSVVVSAAQSVPGVESVAVERFERMFDGPRGEIEAGFIGFGPFEIAHCDSDPSWPENGTINLAMGGGR